jgi:hypothetical protein
MISHAHLRVCLAVELAKGVSQGRDGQVPRAGLCIRGEQIEVRRDALRGVYAGVGNALQGDSEAARKKVNSMWKQMAKRYAELYAVMDA